jgi:urea transport system permease protein
MRAKPTTLAAAIWIVLAVLPGVAENWQVGQLAQFLCYGIFAMSLALVWGQGGLLCFGQAVFFGIGAYAMSVVTLGMVPGLENLRSSYLGLLAAVALPAAFANLLGRFLFSGRGLQGAYFGIVTLAVGVVAERLAVNWDYIGGLNGLMNVPPLTLGLLGGGIEIWEVVPVYYITLTIAFVVYALLEGLARSRYGIAVRALRDDETRTEFFGYDTRAYKLTVFTLGAAIAGLAGALFVTQFGFASPPLIGFTLSTEVLIWVALGGRTYLLAAFLGAIVVRYLEDVLSERLGAAWLLVLGILFIVNVIYLPRGLIGEVLHWLSERPRGSGPKATSFGSGSTS